MVRSMQEEVEEGNKGRQLRKEVRKAVEEGRKESKKREGGGGGGGAG